MLGLLLFPTLLGLSFALDYMSDDEEEQPVETELPDDVVAFEGTDAKDHVTGNALDNLIFGSEGEDLLSGAEGADALFGGADDDRIFGGEGDDIALGGDGDDKIFLGDGDDSTLQQDGTYGDTGDDFIRGGAGNDNIFDTIGSNQIHGDLGHDQIVTVDGLNPDGSVEPTEAAPTADTIHAGFGNDTLIGDDGDMLTGGGGEDNFVVVTAITTPGTPAVLTDFDIRDDLLSLVFLDGPPDDPFVRFSIDAETDQISAAVDRKVVATLDGLTAGDMPFIRTYVTTLPELLATA